MEQLVKTIQETIREVFNENDSFSDVDLAYTFLLGIAISPVKDLLADFKNTAQDGLRFYTSRRKSKESRYKGREISNNQVEELTVKTLELLEYKSRRAGDNLDFCDDELIDEQQYFDAGFYDFAEMLDKYDKEKRTIVTGKIRNVSVRSAGKNKFAYLLLEDYKGKTLSVLVSSTFYSDYEQNLKNCKGKYAGVVGNIVYDDYRKAYIIRAYELDIIDGYHIPRVPIGTH